MPTGSVTLYPSNNDTSNYAYASVNASYPLINPIGKGSNNTTYSQWNLKTGSRAVSYVFYKFDCSSIPANATINSVACSAKGYISQTNSQRIATRQMQMYYGTNTAKGSAVTVSTSASAQNITCGSWTRAELNDIRIRCYAVRGTSNTTTTYYQRFYGATLTITYTYEETKYTITTSITNGELISPTKPSMEVEKNKSCEILFKGNDGFDFQSMKVNNVSVTPQHHTDGKIQVPFSITTNYTTNSSYPLSNATDGDESTFWRSSNYQTTGNYIQFTFDKVCTVERLAIKCNASVVNMLQSSVDGNTWTDICSATEDTLSELTLDIENIKHLRIYANSRSYSLFDIYEIDITATIDGGDYYSYTIPSITEAKNVVITFVNLYNNVRLKINGSWVKSKAVYRKVDGSWILHEEYAFEEGKTYKYVGNVDS